MMRAIFRLQVFLLLNPVNILLTSCTEQTQSQSTGSSVTPTQSAQETTTRNEGNMFQTRRDKNPMSPSINKEALESHVSPRDDSHVLTTQSEEDSAVLISEENTVASLLQLNSTVTEAVTAYQDYDVMAQLDDSSPNQTTGSGNESRTATGKHGAFEYAKVLVPSFLFIGLFGNSLSILVMSSAEFSHTTMSGIIIALSISDTALNVMSPLNKKFFLQLLPADPRSISVLSCKVFFWLWRTAKITSSWFVVLISIERFIAVRFPMKAALLNSKKNARISTALVYLIIGGLNAGWGVVSDTLVKGVCVPNYPTVPQNIAVSKVLVVIGACIYSMIPAIIIAAFNLTIIIKLIENYRKRKAMQATDIQGKAATKLSHTTMMLVSVSVCFVILVTPIAIGHVIAPFSGEMIFQSSNPTFAMFVEVSQSLEQFNYSINFFLYVSFSERFRRQAKKILTLGLCRSRGGPQPRVNSANSTKATGSVSH